MNCNFRRGNNFQTPDRKATCRLNKIQKSVRAYQAFPSLSVPFGVTYEKIGTIQRRLAWPLHKDDTLSRSGRPTGLNIYFLFRLNPKVCVPVLIQLLVKMHNKILSSDFSFRSSKNFILFTGIPSQGISNVYIGGVSA